jgi:large repetitive protein
MKPGGTGAYLKDYSGNGNHGTPTGTTVAEGISGKARSFNGSSDYITTTDIDNVVEGTGDFTVSFWTLIRNYTTEQNIIGTRSSMNYGIGWNIAQSINRMYFIATNNPSSWDIVYFISNNSYVGWNYYTLTRAGTSLQWYVNGQPIGSSVTSSSVIGDNNNPVYIGAGKNASSSNIDSFFDGNVDDIRISNVARSAEEIMESYRMGRDHRIGREPLLRWTCPLLPASPFGLPVMP